jgi:hypothetical protein
VFLFRFFILFYICETIDRCWQISELTVFEVLLLLLSALCSLSRTARARTTAFWVMRHVRHLVVDSDGHPRGQHDRIFFMREALSNIFVITAY